MKKALAILICCLMLLALTSCESEIGSASPANTDAAPDEGADVTTTVQAIRLKRNVKANEQITADDLELADISTIAFSEDLATIIDDTVAKYAGEDLFAGDFLYKAQLSSKQNTTPPRKDNVLDIATSSRYFLVVTDFIKPNTGKDVYADLQKLINENPGRTLYFPDGEYIISQSLVTRSEGPKSTTFYLSDNAVIKAAEEWKVVNGRNALINLGQIRENGTHVNDSGSVGSYFGVQGGVLDGCNEADGVCIESSRESFVYDICIKNTVKGIIIKKGANSNSSDSDIENVEIIGSGISGSVGIDVVGFDNSFSNVKIYNMENGIASSSAGNIYRSIEIYFSEKYPNYDKTIGINQYSNASFFVDCYVENAHTAYRMVTYGGYMLDGLSAGWTYEAEKQTAFAFPGGLGSHITGSRVDFCGKGEVRAFITAVDGSGKIDNPVFDTTLETNGRYKHFLKNPADIVDLSKQK